MTNGSATAAHPADSLATGAWLTAERARAYATMLLVAYVLFVVGLLVTANGLVDALGRPLGTDFANIWSSGRLVLEGRPAVAFDPVQQEPYQQALLGSSPAYFYGWHYPPMFLAVAGLLATMPYLPALAVWLLATSTAYVAIVRAIVGTVAPGMLVMLLALASPAVFANVTHGHNGLLSAALFGTGLYLLDRRPLLAGLTFGLLAYKPQYGLFIPLVLALDGRWRTIAAAAATVIATILASIVLFGLASWDAFLTHTAFTREVILEAGGAGWFKLQGVFPAVRMYGGSTSLAYTLQAVWMLAVGIALVWLWRARSASFEQRAAALVLATMLATPYAFNYDSAILMVAIAYLARHAHRAGAAPYEITLLALLWLAPLISREATALLHVPFALLVQATVFGHLLHRVARTETAPSSAPTGSPHEPRPRAA
jgi:hypothetical protein